MYSNYLQNLSFIYYYKSFDCYMPMIKILQKNLLFLNQKDYLWKLFCDHSFRMRQPT